MACNYRMRRGSLHARLCYRFCSRIPAILGIRDKVQEIKEKYNVLLEKAKTQVQDNLLFFDYAGDLSISADLSNELCYIYPDKYIAVAYMKGPITNISLRGKNVKKIIEKILISLENASGGGHEDAVGSRIQSKDLAKFRELLEKQIK